MNLNKILIVTSEFPPLPGGIGNHAYNLALNLYKQNYDVTVLADYRSKDIIEDEEFDNKAPFDIIRIPRYTFLMKTYFERIFQYRKYIIKENPKIILASGKFPLWLVGLSSLTRSEKRKIAVIHGSEVNLKSPIAKKIVELSLKRFDKIIAVSNYTKSLIDYLKIDHVEVVPNGFDKRGFENGIDSVQLKGDLVLITVGNVSQRKGQHNVIEKLPELINHFPSIHYHIVGIPTDKNKLEILAKSLKVSDFITFHGVVSQSILNSMLNKSDIFVMLSEHTQSGDVEGFGIALIEANFLGVPTIGSINCGIEDAIEDNKSGILIDPQNSIELVNSIKSIMKNKDLFRINAKKWASKHTWDVIISRYINIFQGK